MEILKTILDLAIGDGYIPKPRNENCLTHLRMNHSIKQKDYILYKKKLLEDVGIESSYRKHTLKNGFETCYVITRRHPEILKARNILYSNGKKQITQEVLKYLDERSLSILFQDDGGAEVVRRKGPKSLEKKYVNNFVLNVQSFDETSVNNLSELLKESLIENKIYKRKGYLVITIPKLLSKMNFVEMIRGHLHESMNYKIQYPLNLTVFNY